MDKPKVILFDVYETLLDMSDVEKRINLLLDSKRGYTVWFEMFMEYCFVDNCTVQFNDFPSIAKATMIMASQKFRVSIADEDFEAVLELLKHLPVRDGVQEALSALIDEAFRIAALTNSPEATVRHRMERTGLVSYFEKVLSAEHVQKYKPSVAVYDWAAKKLGVAPEEVLMLTAHGWDVAGAANAGMKTAYVRQGKQMLYPLAPKPDFTIDNLIQLASMIGDAAGH